MSRAVPSHLAPLEDARVEQAASAARTSRRNQPKGLLIVSGMFMFLMFVYVLMAWFSHRNAISSLDAARTQAGTTVTMAGRVQALRAAAATNPTQGGTVSQLHTRIEQAGMDAGLARPVEVPKSRSQPYPKLGSKQLKYNYEVNDPSLSALLTWVEKAVAAVPGLEVYSIVVKPLPDHWNIKVTFSRWEKLEKSEGSQ